MRTLFKFKQTLQFVDSLKSIIGTSDVMRVLRSSIADAIRAESGNVLILGPSGSGKELVAKAIGSAMKGPYLSVSVPSIPEQTFEGEFFGYQEGAFTGANHDHTGILESAHGGGLFLDEIGSIPKNVQVKLLRALETKTISRLGSTEAIPINVRIIAATDQDILNPEFFSPQLLYRLNDFMIRVPALNEHVEDVVLLAKHFFDTLKLKRNRGWLQMSPEIYEYLSRLDWSKNNVRQLRSYINKLIMTSPSSPVTMTHAVEIWENEEPVTREFPSLQNITSTGKSLEDEVNELRTIRIRAELDACKGNISLCAVRLGISRDKLVTLMKRLGIQTTKQ